MEVPTRDPEKRIQIGPKKKIAFVCSGGATKAGAFHLGVALALQEQGFRFYGGIAPLSGVAPKPGPMDISTYVGSSAGSIISSYLTAGYSLDNIFNSFLGKTGKPLDPADALPKILPRLTYQKMFKLKPHFGMAELSQMGRLRRTFLELWDGQWESLMKLKWLKMSGFFSTAGIEQYLREEVLPSNRFQDYLADLFIVATQLNHSRKVVFGKYCYPPPKNDPTCKYDNQVGIGDACAASTSLPVVFCPHPIKNANNRQIYYVDGEIRDTLSTHVAIDNGADLVIASYTHQPYRFQREIGSLTEQGFPAVVIQSIYVLIEQKIKNHIYNKDIQRNAIHAVSQYCKENLSEKHRRKICEILERELDHRMNVDTLYIHPSPMDQRIFFGDHFSLAPKKMAEIVASGFRSAIETLRKYDFSDRKEKHAMGISEGLI